MGKPRPVTWNGIEYANMAEAARALGITRERMRQRVNEGKTCDDDRYPPEQWGAWRKKPCVWNGIDYESVAEAAEANNMPYETMRYRIAEEKQCDDDLYRPCTWNDVKYPSVAEAARANRTPYPTMYAWIITQGYERDSDVPMARKSHQAPRESRGKGRAE